MLSQKLPTLWQLHKRGMIKPDKSNRRWKYQNFFFFRDNLKNAGSISYQF